MKPSERIYRIINDDPRLGGKGANPEVLRTDAIIGYLDEQYGVTWQRLFKAQYGLRERVKNRVGGALGIQFKMFPAQGKALMSKEDFEFLTEQIDKAIDEEFGR